MERGASYRRAIMLGKHDLFVKQVLNNTGSYLDMSTSCDPCNLDTDFVTVGRLGITTLKTDAWLSQTQNMATSSCFSFFEVSYSYV